LAAQPVLGAAVQASAQQIPIATGGDNNLLSSSAPVPLPMGAPPAEETTPVIIANIPAVDVDTMPALSSFMADSAGTVDRHPVPLGDVPADGSSNDPSSEQAVVAQAIFTGDQLPDAILASPAMPVIKGTAASVDDLSDPRENPHRLTAGHLADVLATGDLARFEVMLAHLTSLRAPLLRRLLRDSGSESLAILGRSIGLDAETFQRQWQSWRQQMSKLTPLPGQPDRRETQRIADFFTAISDSQVDRLIQRWRNDGDRLFSAAATSA
jgi:hypothetical protein